MTISAMNKFCILQLLVLVLIFSVQESHGFIQPGLQQRFTTVKPYMERLPFPPYNAFPSSSLSSSVQDLDVIGLVAGQENYGLAIVCVGEALWSFLSAPSLSHAKVLIPAAVAALVLVVVSGPMITSGDVGSVGTGLWIATAVSTGLGVSYIARMLSSFSPSPKEIAAFGLLVSIAGFFSFSQNLLVDGFVSLPSLPSLPTFEFPEINFDAPIDIPGFNGGASVDVPEVTIDAPVAIPEVTMDVPVALPEVTTEVPSLGEPLLPEPDVLADALSSGVKASP